MRKIGASLLVLLWMMLIFTFSSANGEESSGLSDKVIETIALNLTDVQKNSKEMDSIKEKYSFLIRKSAHFLVYFILGILVMNALYTFKVNRYMIIYASLICIIYAITDEFHQTFVNKRSGQISDVLLDSSASLIANYLFMRLVVLRNEKKNN